MSMAGKAGVGWLTEREGEEADEGEKARGRERAREGERAWEATLRAGERALQRRKFYGRP